MPSSGAGPASRACCSPTRSQLPDDVGYRGPSACQVAGITYRQLDYWARTGLVEPIDPPRRRLRHPAALLVPGHPGPQGRQAAARHRRLAAATSASPSSTCASAASSDLASITLISDGTTVYECTSADEVVDLLQGGQGVFGIAVVRRHARGRPARSRTSRASAPTAAPSTPRPRTSWRPAPTARPATAPPIGSQSGALAATAGSRPDVAAPAVDPARESPAQPARGAEGAILPGTSQAPGPRGRGASGKRSALARPPTGKAGPTGVNLSGARRVTTEGEASRRRTRPEATPMPPAPTRTSPPTLADARARRRRSPTATSARRATTTPRCWPSSAAAVLDELVDDGGARRDPARPSRSRSPAARTEAEVLAELRALAARNTVAGADDRPRLLRHDHARR